MSIICVGDLCCDLIVPYGKMKEALAAGDFSSGSASSMLVKMQCGGSVGNTVRALGSLGAKPLFVTPLKEDDLGLFLKSEMEKSGADMRFATPSARSNMYCVAVLDESGERTMFCFIPPWADYPRFDAGSFSKIPAGSPGQILFTSGMALLEDAENNAAVLDFFKKQKAEGSRIIFDLNIRAESYACEGIRRESIEEMICLSDIVLGSGEDEFYAVSGIRDLRRAAEEILKKCGGTVIARNGAMPVLVLGKGSESGDGTVIPVRPVRVISTLGAGDAFDAMFLMQLMLKKDICAAVRMASDYAGEKISRPDGQL